MAKKERNAGINLLKAMAACMIVLLHMNTHGGILDAADGKGMNDLASRLIYAMAFGAVNIYAIISGYVSIQSKGRWDRIIVLWLEVFLYSVGLYIFCAIVFKYFSSKQLLYHFFPITTCRYWYFSVYFLVASLMPFLNHLAASLQKRQYRVLLILGLILFSGVEWLSSCLDLSTFMLRNGYSPVWLVYLYLLGGYIRLYPEDFNRRSNKNYLFIYMGSSLFLWISHYVIGWLTKQLLGYSMMGNCFYSYLSLPVVIGAAALVVFFSRLKLQKGKKLAHIAAAGSFAVYLIHDHFAVREHIMRGTFAQLGTESWYIMLVGMILIALGIVVIGVLMDYLRSILFRLLHVSQGAVWLVQKVKGIMRNPKTSIYKN